MPDVASLFERWISPANMKGLMNRTMPSECPYPMMWYGSAKGTGVSDFTYLQCAPYLETVNAQVTFSIPDLNIVGQPLVYENSARFLDVPPSSNDGSIWAWQEDFPNPATSWTNGNSVAWHKASDAFFGHLLTAEGSFKKQDSTLLLGPSNLERPINTTNNLYGVWMA